MRKLTSRLLLLGCLTAGAAQAQQAVPPPKTEFLDSTYHVVASEKGACYRRETAYTDSVGGTVRSYYLSGQPASVADYIHIRKGVYHGIYESWYPDGQPEWHQEYANGKRNGDSRLYYESGRLKRRETYAAGERSSGECFGPTGAVVPFFEYEVMPVYSEGDGGQQAITQAIGRRVQYPKIALRDNIEGRVFVGFVVDSQGRVVDVRVVKGVHPSVDAAAVAAVQRLGAFQPGLQDGQRVAVSYTMPITFRIRPDRLPLESREHYEQRVRMHLETGR